MWQVISTFLESPIKDYLLVLFGAFLGYVFHYISQIHGEKRIIAKELYNEVADIERNGAYRFVSKSQSKFESLDYYSKDKLPENLKKKLEEYCKELNCLGEHKHLIKTKLYGHLKDWEPSIIRGDANSCYYLSLGEYVKNTDPLIEDCVLDIFRKTLKQFVEDIKASLPNSAVKDIETRLKDERTLSELDTLQVFIKEIPETSRADSLDKEILALAKEIKEKLKKSMSPFHGSFYWPL